MCKEYNGWSNYETWATNLWISEGMLGEPIGIDEQAAQFAQNNDSDADAATYEMAKWLREEVEQAMDELPSGAGLAQDLLGAALGVVDWHEIARHYVEAAIQLEQELTANANA